MSEPISRSTSSASSLLLEHDGDASTTPSTTHSSRSGSPAKRGVLTPPMKAERGASPLGEVHKSWGELISHHEVPRKVLHVSIGFLGLHLFRSGVQPPFLVRTLSTPLAIITSADLLRFSVPSFNRFYIRVLGAFMRESEVRSWNGVIWYLVGTIGVLVLFPKDVATLSILLLSWCDTAASTAGRKWGRFTPQIRRGKSLAGSLAAAVVGALATGLFFGWLMPNTDVSTHEMTPVMWRERLGIEGVGEVTGWAAVGIMSVVTGVIASVSEMMDVWGADDNVVIPILSAVGIWGVLKVFG